MWVDAATAMAEVWGILEGTVEEARAKADTVNLMVAMEAATGAEMAEGAMTTPVKEAALAAAMEANAP